MDSQNETAQLRYLEETSIRLRRMDFETMPAEDQQLPVKWNGSDLCRITGKGSVYYRREDKLMVQEDALVNRGCSEIKSLQPFAFLWTI